MTRTTHGYHIEGTSESDEELEPKLMARCGGPSGCTNCAEEFIRAHKNPIDPGLFDTLKEPDILELLRKAVYIHNYVDVGKSLETIFGASKARVKEALSELEKEGYKIFYFTLGIKTMKILSSAETTYREVHENLNNVIQITRTE